MGAIDEVKERLNIDVVMQNTELLLKRSGNGEWKGLCPFHSEKTPSFYISEEKRVYNCFGCGAHGSLIDLYANLNNLSFSQAVEDLSIKYQIAPDQEDKHKADILRKLSLLQFQLVKHLSSNTAAMQYLTSRGLNEDMIEKAKLGFWKKGNWSNSLHISLEDLQLMGLANHRGASLEGRVIFPITDRRGEVISFAGRAINGENPKYLNGAESPLYKKNKVLYGLPVTQPLVVVVEGYLDQIAVSSLGYDAVALCGTAISDAQAQMFRDKTVVILTDSDDAGDQAKMRVTQYLLKEKVSIKWGSIVAGKDAFECWSMSPDLLKIAIDDAQPLLEALLQIAESAKNKPIQTKREIWQDIKSVVQSISDPFQRTELMEQINQRFEIDGLASYVRTVVATSTAPQRRSVINSLELEATKLALTGSPVLSGWEITDKTIRSIYRKAVDQEKLGELSKNLDQETWEELTSPKIYTSTEALKIDLAREWLSVAKKKHSTLLVEAEEALYEVDQKIHNGEINEDLVKTLWNKSIKVWKEWRLPVIKKALFSPTPPPPESIMDLASFALDYFWNEEVPEHIHHVQLNLFASCRGSDRFLVSLIKSTCQCDEKEHYPLLGVVPFITDPALQEECIEYICDQYSNLTIEDIEEIEFIQELIQSGNT